MILLLVYVGFALAISFICSLLEATLLSARIGWLSVMAAAGNQGAGKLRALKQHRIDDAISAILTLNTVANTLGATHGAGGGLGGRRTDGCCAGRPARRGRRAAGGGRLPVGLARSQPQRRKYVEPRRRRSTHE